VVSIREEGKVPRKRDMGPKRKKAHNRDTKTTTKKGEKEKNLVGFPRSGKGTFGNGGQDWGKKKIQRLRGKKRQTLRDTEKKEIRCGIPTQKKKKKGEKGILEWRRRG